MSALDELYSLFRRALPAGGTAGQVLQKQSTTDFDAAWATPAVVSGPAFSAYAATGTVVATTTITKVTLDAEEFDTAGNFAASRFTPTTSGYYQIDWHLAFDAGTPVYVLSMLFKNGTRYKDGTFAAQPVAGGGGHSGGSSVVFFNGTTDYVEMFAFIGAGPNTTSVVDGSRNYMNGVWIRA